MCLHQGRVDDALATTETEYIGVCGDTVGASESVRTLMAMMCLRQGKARESELCACDKGK